MPNHCSLHYCSSSFPFFHFPHGFCSCGFSYQKNNWSPTKKLEDILNTIYDFFISPKIDNCFTNQLNEYTKLYKENDLKGNYIFINEIEKEDIISVFKVKDKKTNEIRALKFINKKELKNKLKDLYIDDINNLEKEYHNCINDLYDEIEMMKEFNNNDNSIKYYDNYHNKNEFCIITELYDDNLLSFLKKKKELNSQEIYIILSQLYNILNNTGRKKNRA